MEHHVELVFTPTYALWANPIEAHFGPLRQFVMANSDHPDHEPRPSDPRGPPLAEQPHPRPATYSRPNVDTEPASAASNNADGAAHAPSPHNNRCVRTSSVRARTTLRFVSARARSRRSLMAMVCGLDLHRQQITFDAAGGGVGRGVAGPVEATGSGPVPPVVTRRRDSSSAGRAGWRWRWKAAPGGGMWWRRSSRGGVRGACGRTGGHASRRVGRKRHAKTDRTDARLCASCCRRASCRSRGSHRRRCWSGVNGYGSTSRWSINAPRGCSASTPSCSSMVSLSERVRSVLSRTQGNDWPATRCTVAGGPAARSTGRLSDDRCRPTWRRSRSNRDLQRFGAASPLVGRWSTPNTGSVG